MSQLLSPKFFHIHQSYHSIVDWNFGLSNLWNCMHHASKLLSLGTKDKLLEHWLANYDVHNLILSQPASSSLFLWFNGCGLLSHRILVIVVCTATACLHVIPAGGSWMFALVSLRVWRRNYVCLVLCYRLWLLYQYLYIGMSEYRHHTFIWGSLQTLDWTSGMEYWIGMTFDPKHPLFLIPHNTVLGLESL